MAKSEHQGLQISLIVFVMVTVVLAIMTFVFYSKAGEATKRADASDKSKQDATTQANDSNSRLEYVLHILGIQKLPEAEADRLKQMFVSDAKMKPVIDNFEQHMSTYGVGLSKEEQNYADVLPKLLTTMRQTNQGISTANADIVKYKEERDSAQKTERARADEAQKGQDLAQKERDAEKTKYQEDRAQLEGKQNQQAVAYTRNIKLREDTIATTKASEAAKDKEIKNVGEANKGLINAIKEFQNEEFESPDGQVTWVNQGAKLVWINLGLADGLRRQTMFSVYEQGDNGIKGTEPKASIEVTRVLDQHLAEARISYDTSANPILRGDQIVSPAWRPGQRIRFALAGVMDIDGDGRSDRNLVRSLLSSNGGQIDFEVHDDGSTEGEMKAGIRYLVLGASPAEGNLANVDRKLLGAYSKAQLDAAQLGIEIIPIEKMLQLVGYRPEVRARTVGLGENADSSNYKMPAPDQRRPVSTTAQPDTFREKKPPEKKMKVVTPKTSASASDK